MSTAGDTRQWDGAVASAAVRLVAGVGLVRTSGLVARLAGASRPDRVSRVVKVLGLRDVALAASAFAATRPGGNAATQLRLQGAADLADGTLVAVAARFGWVSRGRGGAIVAVAAASAAAELLLAQRLAALRA